MTIFFRALGEALAGIDGLRSAFVPPGIGHAAALEIAEAANAFRGASTHEPYAVVVSSPNFLHSTESPLMISLNETIRYRIGNRLFIFLDSSRALASIDKSAHVLMPDSYPDVAESPVDFQNLGLTISSLAIEGANLEIDQEFQSFLATYVTSILRTLAELHKHTTVAASNDWNVNWFRHANLGVENLFALLERSLGTNGVDVESLKEKAFAAFGLPRPANGHLLRNRDSGIHQEFEIARSSFWKDESQVEVTLEHLRQKYQLEIPHPISSLNWAGLDRAIASHDNFLLALIELAGHNEESIEIFAKFIEDDFFSPLPKNLGGELIVSNATSGEIQRVRSASQASKLGFVYLREEAIDASGKVTFASDPIQIKVPTLQPISDQDLASSKLSLSISKQRNLSFQGGVLIDGGSLVFQGIFVLEAGKPPFKFINKPVGLSLSLGSKDSLLGKIDERATNSLLLLPDFASGLLVAEVSSNGRLSKLTHVGPDGSDDDDGSFRHEISSPGKPHVLIAWTSPFLIEGDEVPPSDEISVLTEAKLTINSNLDLIVGEDSYSILTPTDQVWIESPVHAAAKKALLTRGEGSPENRSSLFGKLESAIGKIVQSISWKQSNLHMVLPSDVAVNFSDLKVFDSETPIMSTEEVFNSWRASTNFSVNPDFLLSSAVTEFHQSFDKLGIPDELIRKLSSPQDEPDWISRTSWAHLWSSRRDELDAYLASFQRMIEAAIETRDQDTLFWASYPFSASVWDTLGSGKCEAVLLSPLHPLRLGWLSSAEWSLRNCENSEGLGGAVEGWNLPAIGPSLTQNGSMIAIPCDSGAGQVFLGWSVMANASSEDFEVPRVPSRIAGVDSPGGGASGLNRSSTSSALNDYRRINPHVTTMVIDLAASSEAPRLKEIDASVLKSISDWAEKEKLQVPGGVRIWDSLNRYGPAPTEEALQVASAMQGVPLTWTRYKHINGSTKRCNVRFLQDSGIKVSVTKSPQVGSERNFGAVGMIPLRRFEAFNGLSPKIGQSHSSPALGSSVPHSSYNSSLRSFEGSSNSNVTIRSQVFKALLVDNNAEWTVSGESLVSPSGIASLLSSGPSSQMLWEWRPPIFDTKEDFSLEKRPFISVARIPDSFKWQVSELVGKAESRVPEIEEVDNVLSNLGSRGVGLSSLISMGGTQSAGALGFHLALKLLDQVADSKGFNFVMPIDACDSFLRVLSGSDAAQDLKERADLLVLTISEGTLILTPVEIKFYGAGSSSSIQPKLPSPGDSILSKAISQAFETKSLLDLVVSKWTAVETESNFASRTLWLNAFATLLESAIKLSPKTIDDPNLLTIELSRLIEGDMKMASGRPIITFFTMNAVSPEGELAGLHAVSDENGEWGLLSLNTAEAFRRAKLDVGDPAWVELAEWCTDASSPIGLDSESEDEVVPSHLSPKKLVVDAVAHTSLSIKEPNGEPTQQSGPDSPEGGTNWRDAFPASDGVRVVVGSGQLDDPEVVADFWPGNTELTQMNMGVVGDLGTGKTQFLRSLVTQIRLSAEKTQSTAVNFLVFDYKKDYRDASFLEAVNGRVLSPDDGIPLNVLALTGEYSKKKAYKRAMAFCDILDKIYGSVGPVQKSHLTETIVGLFENHPQKRAPTLSKVSSAYKEKAGKDDSITAILNKFVLSGVFVEDQSKLESLDSLMHDRVTVVSLNELGADSDTKNALVVLMLDLYYEYMLSSTKWPFIGNNPQIRTLNSFLLVDEATNIMQYDFPVLKNLLLEGREWGFGVILASQYLSHFKTSNNNYGEPLKTWVIHKVPSVKLKELVELGLSEPDDQTVQQIAKLKVHEIMYDSLGLPSQKFKGLPFYQLNI
jgi:DNA phosphorothioation-dependent restriction protein DptH